MAFDLDQIFYPPITRERFEAIRSDGSTHRICFATAHAGQPKRSSDPRWVGSFNLPFGSTVRRLLKGDCGLDLFPSKGAYGGVWRSIGTEAEFNTLDAWVKRQGTRVFLRDCLTLSVALGHNLAVDEGGVGGHTRLGDLESRAKAAPDEAALDLLLTEFTTTIRDLPAYRDARMITGVPPSPGKVYDLPTVLAARIAATLNLRDLTPHFTFAHPKGTVKTAAVGDKWAAWAMSGLSFSALLERRPPVILIDDKYQSGASIHFVASVLRAAGAGDIYGLCAVKAMRDTDNT